MVAVFHLFRRELARRLFFLERTDLSARIHNFFGLPIISLKCVLCFHAQNTTRHMSLKYHNLAFTSLKFEIRSLQWKKLWMTTRVCIQGQPINAIKTRKKKRASLVELGTYRSCP